MDARLCGGNSRRLLVEPFGDSDYVEFSAPVIGFHGFPGGVVITTADRMLHILRHEALRDTISVHPITHL